LETELLTLMSGGKRPQGGVVLSSAFDVDVEEFLAENRAKTNFLPNALASAKQFSDGGSCTKVWEGDRYNPNVTSSPAIVALGLCYLQTGDLSMAEKLAPPKTTGVLQTLNPLQAMLRVMFASLIMWDELPPRGSSILRFVPPCLISLAERCNESAELLEDQKNGYFLILLGYCIAGGVLAMGIRYAGSMNMDAKEVVVAELKAFLNGKVGTAGGTAPLLQAKSATYAGCISACASALGLIMAGSGDSNSFSLLRKLNKRTTGVSYGDHMAVAQAIGFLFLSGGKSTFDVSLQNVASLILATFPAWPTDTTDNSFYLQALRHMYATSIVPRMLQTVDVETHEPVSVNVRLVLNQSSRFGVNDDRAETLGKMWTPMPASSPERTYGVAVATPCLLPPTDTISRIEIRSVHHYPAQIVMDNLSNLNRSQLVVGVLARDRPSSNGFICDDEQRVQDHIFGVTAEIGSTLSSPGPKITGGSGLSLLPTSAFHRALVDQRMASLCHFYRKLVAVDSNSLSGVQQPLTTTSILPMAGVSAVGVSATTVPDSSARPGIDRVHEAQRKLDHLYWSVLHYLAVTRRAPAEDSLLLQLLLKDDSDTVLGTAFSGQRLIQFSGIVRSAFAHFGIAHHQGVGGGLRARLQTISVQSQANPITRLQALLAVSKDTGIPSHIIELLLLGVGAPSRSSS
jgi:hypothetical protein